MRRHCVSGCFPSRLLERLRHVFNLHQTLTSWKDVETKVLACFLSPPKNTEAKVAIATFVQGVNEPLREAWERSKTFLRKSPSCGLEVEMQVQTFCRGLQSQTKIILYASFSSSILFKTVEEAVAIEITTRRRFEKI